MNGNVISAFGQAQNARFSEAQAIQEYLYRLSIDTANETELENIGRIIGYVRPLVPEGFNAENIFLLGGLPLETDPSIGLAEAGTVLGGRLSTVASVISKDYTIEFNANADIVIHYKKSIGYKNVWILTQLFYRTMTEPQVLIVSGR